MLRTVLNSTRTPSCNCQAIDAVVPLAKSPQLESGPVVPYHCMILRMTRDFDKTKQHGLLMLFFVAEKDTPLSQ
jgi:hypothetical protein